MGNPTQPAEAATDPVDEASEGSFPASDPPQWSTAHAGTPVGAPAAAAGRGRSRPAESRKPPAAPQPR